MTLTCVMRVSFSMGLKDLFDAVEVRADAAALPNADMVKFLGDVKAIMETDGITPVLRVAWKLRGHAGPYQLWHGKVQGGFRDPLRVCFDEDSGVAYPLPNNALQYAKLDVVANPLPLAPEGAHTHTTRLTPVGGGCGDRIISFYNVIKKIPKNGILFEKFF